MIPLAFGAGWLIGYGPFFLYVARERPSMLGPAVALNAWFSVVIGLGAAVGAAQALLGREGPVTRAPAGSRRAAASSSG